MSKPSNKTCPLVGAYRPASTLSKVDFPDPIGPSMAMRSPGRIVSLLILIAGLSLSL